MKKILCFLMTWALLLAPASGLCSKYEMESTPETEAEVVVAVMTPTFGEPVLVPSQMDPDDPSDQVNTRVLLINPPDAENKFVLMIRISDSQLAAWEVPLSKTNLAVAKFVFDENAPDCTVLLYQDGKIADSAYYFLALKEQTPFDEFLEKADAIISSLYP